MQTHDVKPIEVGSPEYRLELDLRMKILRRPLGLTFSPDDLEKERTDVHLGAFDGATLLGCLILTPLSASTIKMRQVAVDDHLQGKGVGRALVEACELKARALGHQVIELNARDTAVPFYLRLGYERVGDPFTEVTIPHHKMRKRL